MKTTTLRLGIAALALTANFASADIGIISPAEAKQLIENSDAKKRPNVRLYEGAWKEYVWLKDKSLPAETGGEPAGK